MVALQASCGRSSELASAVHARQAAARPMSIAQIQAASCKEEVTPKELVWLHCSLVCIYALE